MEGFILLGEIYGSIYNHDLYDVGKSIAESMFKVIGNDELLDWMIRVREIEKQEKIELEIKMAKEKAKAELEEKLYLDSIDESPEGKRKYELEIEEFEDPTGKIKAARLKNEAYEAHVH
jgi:hypothetical protein